MPRTSSLRRIASRPSRSPAIVGGAITAAALAVTALLVRRAAKKAEQRNPATGQFIEVDGVRLHYIETGQGQPVVLLHGNGDFARDFVASGLVDHLANQYRVIAFDRPGFGYSERPRLHLWTPMAQARLLLNACERLGIRKPVVVGHSWGALVAIAMALQNPDAVQGLLLVSGYYYPTPRPEMLLLATPAIPVIGDVMRYTISPLVGRLIGPALLRRIFGPQPVPDAFKVEVPLALTLRPWQLRATAADLGMLIPAAAVLARRYRELSVPVTIIAGTNDHIADYRAHSVRLHEEVSDSRLQILAGLGHMPHYFAAEQLAAAVDDLASRELLAPGTATSGEQAGGWVEE